MNLEKTETYGLAALGAAEGIWTYYVKPELTAKRAWVAMGLGILAYEMTCPQGELLSEGVDRALEKHPVLTASAIGVTALHLMNALPESIDPYSRFMEAIKKSSFLET